MARRYSDSSFINLGGSELPMDKKKKMVPQMPTGGLTIAPDWDSIEGVDSNMRSTIKGLTKKRK